MMWKQQYYFTFNEYFNTLYFSHIIIGLVHVEYRRQSLID